MPIVCIDPEYFELFLNSTSDWTEHFYFLPISLSFDSCLAFRKTDVLYKFGGEILPNSISTTFARLQLQARSVFNDCPISWRFIPFNGLFVLCRCSSPFVLFVKIETSSGFSSSGLDSLQPKRLASQSLHFALNVM